MNKNTLYEVLEVSENASQEIIEKAYKTLAKRYHPDLQSDAEKNNAEQKMKKINEAYDILSDKEKRQVYDRELKQQREQIKQQELEKQREKIYNEYNINNKNNTENYYNNPQYHNEYAYKENDNISNNNFANNTENYSDTYNDTQNYDDTCEEMKQDAERRTAELKRRTIEQEEINRQYQNAYEDYLRSLGYKIKHKWTKEDYKNFFITIVIIVVVALILWAIPPVRNSIINFYEQNPIFKSIVDVFIAIIKGIWNTIVSLFS